MATSLRHPEPETVAGEPIYYSVEMVDALNAAVEDRLPRYECVYGELFVTVTPARPWHYAVAERLWFALKVYAQHEPAAGYVGAFESKLTFGRSDVYVSPDVWAVRLDEWRRQDWAALTAPLLVAEVLSPSTSKRDRFQKRRAYMEAGTALYWIIDADERWVEVWTPGQNFPRFEREQLVWHPEGAQAPFTLALAELFAPV